MSFKEYFEYYQKYTKKYDGNVAVLIQCGSFFEIYGIDNETEVVNPQLPHLSNILNMTLSRKNKKIKENNIQNPQFVGFPIYALQKYIPVLLDHSYTVVIVEQVTDAPNPQRKVTQILSPGTKLDYFRDDTNNLVSIYFENNNKKLFVGLSSIDFSTGTSVTYETHSNIEDEDLCLDEVFKFITSQSPKEILISSHNLQNTFITNDYLLKNLSLHNIVTHISLQNIDSIYFNTSYQNDFLRKIYNPPFMSPIEFLDLEHYHFSTISFLKLLQFAYEHNENIISSIQKPTILTNTSQLYLLNNTIKQLNLYEKSGNISLFSLINHTSTVMGKRLLKSHLLNPITDINTLNTRYNFIDDMTNTYEQY